METVIAAIVTALATAVGAWLLHKQEVAKQKTAAEVAATAMHTALNERMRAHVDFVEARLLTEREWNKHELEREREECAEAINSLAGRLGLAEAELKQLRRVAGNGKEGGLPKT